MGKRDYRSGRSEYHPLGKIRIALAGVSQAVFRDFSVRYKLAISVVFLVIAGVFETFFHFLFVLEVTAVMLVAEIFNTVIESLCDYVQPNDDERIKHIKDMAAGAAFIAILIWYVVLGVVLYELVTTTELFSVVARP